MANPKKMLQLLVHFTAITIAMAIFQLLLRVPLSYGHIGPTIASHCCPSICWPEMVPSDFKVQGKLIENPSQSQRLPVRYNSAERTQLWLLTTVLLIQMLLLRDLPIPIGSDFRYWPTLTLT